MASEYTQQGKTAAGKRQLAHRKAVDITPIEVLYFYSSSDEKLRDELEKHLKPLIQQKDITTWDESRIGPGENREQEIITHLNSARIILLLISPDFMISDYCNSEMLTRVLKLHEKGEVYVIPIILRPVDWQQSPFGSLQALPKGTKPVTSWPSRDEAFLDIVKGIREAINRVRRSRSDPPSPSKSLWIVPSYYPRNPSFTDRTGILHSLRKAFTTSKKGKLAQQIVRGLDGIGKTQLTLEYAYRYRDNYQAVFWINATSQETLNADFVNIALELQLLGEYAQDQTFAVDAVKHWLETNTNWLLIFDNVDDLDLVNLFLPSEGKIEGEGHILLTTGTQRTPLTMKSVKIKKMEQEDGILFLLRRAQIIASDASLDAASAEDRKIASQIVLELSSVPLALDQAGAYMYETKCSLSRYLQLYKSQRAALMRRRDKSLPYPVKTVAATWHLAFEKVEQDNPAAADLLRLCAFLAPDAIPEAIISEGAPDLGPVLLPIATDPLKLDEGIEMLLKYSLVDREGETLTIQRLVQTVLQDEMDRNTRRLWSEHAIRAVNRVFPKVDATTWSLYMPQVQNCAELMKDYKLLFLEASQLLYEAGHYLFDHAQYEQVEPLYLQALKIREQIQGTGYPDTANILHGLAKLYHTKKDYIKAEPLYRRALEIRKQVPGIGYPDTASILHDLAWLYKDLDQFRQAEALFKEALEISKQVLGTEHPITASILHDLAWLYQDRGQYLEAERFFKQALEIRERVLGPHDQAADTLHALAWFYAKQNDYKQAEVFYQRALDMRKQVLELAPATANTLFDFAWLCKNQRHYPEAEQFFKQALEIRKQVLGTEHPDTARILHDLAWLYQDMGWYKEAEQFFKEALEIRRQMPGPQGQTDTANTLYGLAWLYQLQGRYKEAEQHYKDVLEIREQVLGHQHHETASTLHSLAWLYQQQARFKQAKAFFKEALSIREQVLGPQHSETQDTLCSLVKLYQDQGQHEQAERLLKKYFSGPRKVAVFATVQHDS